MSIKGRALHYVFKIGNRSKNAQFFLDILGMKVLRHEEFTEGCDAQCNGPYDNRWSKTMIGYGPESSHFVMELTYNYGVKSYEMGNDFGGVTIKSKEIIDRATAKNYPFQDHGKHKLLISPDGYKFCILNESQSNDRDPVVKVTLNSSNLNASIKYWHDILNMKIIEKNDKSVLLTYGENQVSLEIQDISDTINHAKAYGRIAFAIPYNMQPQVDEIIKKNNQKILTPLISLDTPGKAKVRVIILADPDGHEICFVDEEGFSELSQFDPKGHELLYKYIEKDPFERSE